MDLIWVFAALLAATAILGVVLTRTMFPDERPPARPRPEPPLDPSPSPPGRGSGNDREPPVPRPLRRADPGPSSAGDSTLPRPSVARTFGRGTTRVTVAGAGILVETRGFGFATSWREQHWLRWDEVRSLTLDTSTYDSNLCLFAAAGSDHHRHLLDGNALSPAEWRALAREISALTEGGVRLDLRRLTGADPYERF